ncbi:hypothetical protein J1N35_044426 [Gossypium stocksii]|uniref:Uncharacterized protein n=1 Tax=Gossypium stocksii TaxID=47602 RepID=A0A9D3U964_9ROSI|nr:hypothetical protein J1N35_044426 [Gossypium stocksii]
MESKCYQYKELHLNFRSLAEVERYESKVIYLGCANKIKENKDQIGLHEPLLALTYEGAEQLNVEESDASTKEIINYENIENVDTYNSPKMGMRIPKEQCHMTKPCNNTYMPNPTTASAPKETIGYITEATPVSTLPPKAQAATTKRRYNKLKPLLEFQNNWIVIESPHKNGRIDKKYCHKECNITLRSLLEVKRYKTDGILPVHGKKKKESNEQSESPAPLLLLTFGEIGQQNEKLGASTMGRTNSTNIHMSNLTALASTAPKAGRHGRKRKVKTMVSSKVEANIRVEQNDEAALIDVPINDETAPIDVPIFDEAALIDVLINDETTPIDVLIIDEAAPIDVRTTDEATLIDVPINDEAAMIDVPINDEVALIDVPIIDEAALINVPINYETVPIDVLIINEDALIDVPITYVKNFSDLGCYR